MCWFSEVLSNSSCPQGPTPPSSPASHVHALVSIRELRQSILSKKMFSATAQGLVYEPEKAHRFLLLTYVMAGFQRLFSALHVNSIQFGHFSVWKPDHIGLFPLFRYRFNWPIMPKHTPTLFALLVSTHMLNHISFLSDSLKIWYMEKKSFFFQYSEMRNWTVLRAELW